MQVLHEDEHLLAVNKPGGLPALPDKTGDPSLIDLLRQRFPADPALELPHRIDRPVSGVVLVCRTASSLVALSKAFAAGAVEKSYWAIVHGIPPPEGTWVHRIAHDARARKARASTDDDGHPVTTHFTKLAQGDRYALLELSPAQGRFHQLRAQCGLAGHPIKGDVKYGARRGEADRTIGLHARSIAFDHPVAGHRLRIEAPLPATPLWVAFSGLVGRTP